MFTYNPLTFRSALNFVPTSRLQLDSLSGDPQSAQPCDNNNSTKFQCSNDAGQFIQTYIISGKNQRKERKRERERLTDRQTDREEIDKRESKTETETER